MKQQDTYPKLKDICERACHERKACVKGYKQMLESENVGQMMQTWRDNWEDLVEGKYADIIRKELPEIYPSLKAEMNKAEVYLNECPESTSQYTRIIVTDTDDPVHIYGRAQAYILGKAKVIAHDHAQIYNYEQRESEVLLLDYSYGYIKAGKVEAQGRSTLTCNCQAVLSGAVICSAQGGTVRAKGYREINAYNDAIIYSRMAEGITLNDNSELLVPEE